MARRPRPTLADYAVIGISPALIMFLIGSLVFFLITVFYQGQFDVRLSFIMVMFIMAAVSIARISINEGREYASLFALPLAGVTLFAMFRFVEFSGAFARLSGVFNIALLAIIWFCADKLTWDCTVIDESKDSSGQGLLETAGLDDGQPTTEPEAASDAPNEPPTAVAAGLWQKFIEHRRRPHAPGIWVIYFSIAALPIFGLGQLFLRDDVSRRYAFKLLVVYVAAALGLLLTTSFLGLRRYLRQRRLEMPKEMAGTWLGVGAAMIAALLLICMLLPRRNAEYSVSDLSFLNSPIDLPVSDWGVGNDGQQQDQAERKVKQDDATSQMEGQKGEGGQTESKQSQSQSGAKSKQSQSKSDGKSSGKKSKGGKKGKSDKSAERSQSDSNEQSSENQQEGEQSNGDQGEPSESGQDQDTSNNEDHDDQEPQDPAESNDPEEDPQDPSNPSGQQKQDSQSQEQPSKSQSKQPRSRQSSSASSNRSNPTKLFSQLSPTLSGILKALYWLIAIAVIAYLVWKNWEQVCKAVQNFIKAMQDLWARLFGGQPSDDEVVVSETTETAPDWRPFSDFSDPFVSGRADRSSTEELIGYTFEAFEAWGRENGCGRLAEQTPIEFAKEAVRCHGELGKDALRVAELYNWTAYGKTQVPDANREYLRRFWQELSACAVV
ncbi:MAG: hypothetical protein QGG71_09715 [Pirellulaceae bacterium]|nr:hypothetical protein [Pirellulaceae bacterium]